MTQAFPKEEDVSIVDDAALSNTSLRGASHGTTSPVLAAPHARRRRLRAGRGPGAVSPATPPEGFWTGQDDAIFHPPIPC